MVGVIDSNISDKNMLQNLVLNKITKQGLIPNQKCDSEVDWFFNKLGIVEKFFVKQDPDKLAEYIHSIYASKICARTSVQSSLSKDENTFLFNVEDHYDEGAIMLCNSQPGPQFEKKIDEKYLAFDPKSKETYRVETYRSTGCVDEDLPAQLRCYIVERCQYLLDKTYNDVRDDCSTRLVDVADSTLLKEYSEILTAAQNCRGPVSKYKILQDGKTALLKICYRRSDGCGNVFSSLSDLYHFYGLTAATKYVEPFKGGLSIVSLELKSLDKDRSLLDSIIPQMIREISLIFSTPLLPGLQLAFVRKEVSLRECAYAYAACLFAGHFVNRLDSEYESLAVLLDNSSDVHLAALSKLKARLKLETRSEGSIRKTVFKYLHLLHALYRHFHTHFHPENYLKSPSFEHLHCTEDLSVEELRHRISASVSSPHEQLVFECILTFNNSILKTNFFSPTKVALSFRLDPSFLPKHEYPQNPFGLFFIVGREFRGFHVRFADVARGGVRVVRSPSADVYLLNVITLFDENYNLALTQQFKNKDIPEGGSKGTILLFPEFNDRPQLAFKKYVDALLDLLVSYEDPGIKEPLIDKYGQPELLFLGPDEGTADLMDWASEHAKNRHAPFWKAFTTGKSPSMGGIPHDVYGMTTRSVRQFVRGVLREQELTENQVTKFQTGGPDGDLGSNEIKLSTEKLVGIVDGSGVLCDPQGIDRTELTRLAESRLMIDSFNVDLLSNEGFRILVTDRSVKLQDGSSVENGLLFRNEFHLNPLSSAMLFVPCGGRPEAININNVNRLLSNGLQFKIIVEGANLFITQRARLVLEKGGVILFKDSSANKGGVTSSSLEVFSGLAMSDESYDRHMRVKDVKNPPIFYQNYVQDVQRIIETNAALEFECIWKESKKTGQSRIIVADKISELITQMSYQIATESNLWDNISLRRKVIEDYTPKSLLDLLGLDSILKTTPESYLKAIFGAFLASRFVYKFGLTSTNFSFFEYMQKYMN